MIMQPDFNLIINTGKSIILFDGVCNLCNGFVKFVIQRDRKARFIFGSLQSESAQHLLIKLNYKNEKLASVVLIENKKIYTQSTAVLRIIKYLHGWNWLYIFIIVPTLIRDLIYRLIATYRYNIFGKQDTCMVPTLELQKRFIDYYTLNQH